MPDKISMLSVSKHLIAISLMVTSFGCASQIPPFNEYAARWIGEPVDRLIKLSERKDSYASSIQWQDKRYELGNGNWVYVSPERRDCIVHWEVNSSRIIVGYRTEGDRCF